MDFYHVLFIWVRLIGDHTGCRICVIVTQLFTRCNRARVTRVSICSAKFVT